MGSRHPPEHRPQNPRPRRRRLRTISTSEILDECERFTARSISISEEVRQALASADHDDADDEPAVTTEDILEEAVVGQGPGEGRREEEQPLITPDDVRIEDKNAIS